jgi:hypothetical protein
MDARRKNSFVENSEENLIGLQNFLQTKLKIQRRDGSPGRRSLVYLD